MKEAIRMVLESIYDPEDTVHFRSGQGCHSVLKRIKEEWGSSRWFLEFDIRKCFHTIDRHRLIQILKEAIADPKFFYSIQKVFSAGRLIGVERGPYSVPHSVLLSALLGNIYLNKLDQEIDFLRNKYEIPIVHKVRLLRAGRRIDDQEARFSTPQDNRALILGKSMPSEAHFHSLVSPWHTPSSLQLRGDQKKPFVSSLEPALIVPSSLLCAAFLIEANGLTPRALFYVKECNNWAMKYYCKRKSPLIELGRESILVIRPERVERKQTSLKTHYLSRICYARYADDLLLGIVGAIELLLEIQKRIAHFLQSGLNLWVGSSTAGSTTIAARSTVEFLGTVIREVSPRPTPIQFLRELEKRLRVKHRIHITTCHLRSGIHSKFKNLGNSIPKLTKGMIRKYRLAETLARVRSPSEGIVIQQESGDISVLHNSGRSNASLNQVVSQSDSGGKFLLSTSTGQKSLGGGGHWVRSISDEFPIKIEAPIKKILRRLRNRGLISRKRPWPIHVACLTNASDEDIVNWFAGIAISLLSYYRGCNNLYQVRTIVDHQIRWSAIFTLAHKHKSSARNIIPKYSKDLNILNQEGGKILAEFPNSLELGKLGPGQGLSKNSTIQNS